MLPYLNYQNRLKANHGVPHCLDMCNGFRVATGPKQRPDDRTNGWNDAALYVSHTHPFPIIFLIESSSICRYDPLLTYGIISKPFVPPFRPKYVLNDNIVLTFNGFFRQHIVEPNYSYDRIRYVNVMYFMEDDTITVMEPPVMVRTCRFTESINIRCNSN